MQKNTPRVKGFPKGIGSYKMPRKSWDSSEIDWEWEERKSALALAGLIIALILIAVFLWWVRKAR